MGSVIDSVRAWVQAAPKTQLIDPSPPLSSEHMPDDPTPESMFKKLVAYVKEDPAEDQTDVRAINQAQLELFVNAPIFSPAAYRCVESKLPRSWSRSEIVPQYGLLGITSETKNDDSCSENRLLLANVNVPWSAFICGSQGSGKSHTMACLLEASLLQQNKVGKLLYPMTGMAMHYDNFTSRSATQLCEAAYLCSSGIPVTVLVSPSNIWAMKSLYTNLPGLGSESPKPRVVPLYLNEDQLNVARILKLMAIKPGGTSIPLYMEVVMRIIREIVMSGTDFTYTNFRQRLSEAEWVKGQETPLNMRLQLLDSFLAPSAATTQTTKPAAVEDTWSFQPGSLTIVDLSDPFLSAEDACCLFSICLSIFLEERSKCGRIVVVDEAHKFLTQSGEAQILTDELTSIIRQQRHTGTRVVIATQEPTLAPKLIDLANVALVHRFTSPAWLNVLERHLAGATDKPGELFNTIVNLRVGEALLFCPTAQIGVGQNEGRHQVLQALGSNYVKVKMRKRLTTDGGRSMLATDAPGRAVTEMVAEDVPMHIVIPNKADRCRKHSLDDMAGSQTPITPVANFFLPSKSGATSTLPQAKITKDQRLGSSTQVTNDNESHQSKEHSSSVAAIPPTGTCANAKGTAMTSEVQTSPAVVASDSTNTKTVIATRAQLYKAANRYVAGIAEEMNWQHSVVLRKEEKDVMYGRFKGSVRIQTGTLTKQDCKTAFFSQLGQRIASLKN